MHPGLLTAQASGFSGQRHAGFGLWKVPFAEWTSQCGVLYLPHRLTMRRTDHGRVVVFWGVAWSASRSYLLLNILQAGPGLC